MLVFQNEHVYKFSRVDKQLAIDPYVCVCVSAALNASPTSLPKSVHEVASTYANLACPSGAPQSTPDVCRSEGSFATLLEAGSHTGPGQALRPSLLMILESLFLCSPGITIVKICPKHPSLLSTSSSYTHLPWGVFNWFAFGNNSAIMPSYHWLRSPLLQWPP